MIKNVKLAELNISLATFVLNISQWFNRIQMFVLQQKLLTKGWWKVKGTIFWYIQIF